MDDETHDLKPANENPWYVLMTLYGEEDGTLSEEDREKNKRVWNSFVTNSRSQEEKFQEYGLSFPSLTARGIDNISRIKEIFLSVWQQRNPFSEHAQFPNRNSLVDLSETKFDLPLNLCGRFFPNGIIFRRTRFKKALSISESGIFGNVSLRQSKFLETVSIDSSVIFGQIDTKLSEFSSHFTLRSTQCSGDLILNAINMRGSVECEEINLEGDLDLQCSHFGANVHFSKANVSGNSYKNGGTILGNLVALDATFQGRVEFKNVDFLGDATFENSTFVDRVSFYDCVFAGYVDFTSAEFGGLTEFTKTQFTKVPNGAYSPFRFNDANFAKPTSFRNTCFLNAYPEFTNVNFHPITDFTANTKNQRFWPSGIVEPRKEARETCGIIRNLLSKKGLHEDQHFFFRMEMQFAAASVNKRERFSYWIYGVLSDFGDSIQRPIIGLFLIWLVGWLTFGGYFSACCAISPIEAYSHPYGTGAAWSFSNLFPPFGFNRTYFDRDFIDALPPALKSFSAFQTVASLPLLFFLGLGLRQRFRLR